MSKNYIFSKLFLSVSSVFHDNVTEVVPNKEYRKIITRIT